MVLENSFKLGKTAVQARQILAKTFHKSMGRLGKAMHFFNLLNDIKKRLRLIHHTFGGGGLCKGRTNSDP